MVRPKLYLAGPYTNGDTMINIRTAYDYAEQLDKIGYCIFVPHATSIWHLLYPKELERWYEFDNEWLRVCDCLYRIPGESHGASMEEDLAEQLKLPVFHDMLEAKNYMKFWEKKHGTTF